LFNLQSSPSLAAKALPSEEELDAEAEVLKAIQNKQEQEDEVEKGDGRRGRSKMAAELDPDTLSQDDYTSYSPAAMQDGLVCLPVEEDDEEGPSAIEIARQLAELEQDVPVKKERTGKEVLAAEAKGLHLEHIRDGLIQFSPCKCKHAGSLGVLSCLMQFSSMDMMVLHKEAYGGVLVGDKGLAASAVASRVHTLMWQMAEELPRKDAWGRSHTISDWRIHGKSVCRKNWERAYGVSERRLRTLYHFVARGIPPAAKDSSDQSKVQARLMDKVTDAAGKLLTRQRDWAADWWKNSIDPPPPLPKIAQNRPKSPKARSPNINPCLVSVFSLSRYSSHAHTVLLLMDYMPNEERILLLKALVQ
jgi:hypothetical protein